MERVSICIPTFNRRVLLERAVESAISQSYRHLEIIISDNNSEDETMNYCLNLTKLDCRVKFFKQERNIGPSGNVKFLLDKASGDYIFVLADDDYLAPDAIEKMVAVLNSQERVIHVTCCATEIGPGASQLFCHYFQGKLGSVGQLRMDVVNNFFINNALGVLVYGLTRARVAKLLPSVELFKLDLSKTVSGCELLHLRFLMLHGDIVVLPRSFLYYMGPGERAGRGSLAAELSRSISKVDGFFLLAQKMVILLYLNFKQLGLSKDSFISGKLITTSFFCYVTRRLLRTV